MGFKNHTGATGGEELNRERGVKPLTGDGFIVELDRLRSLPAVRGKIRKLGSRYFGIALPQSRIARPVR